MNSDSRSTRSWPRTRRQVTGQPSSAITTMTEPMLGPTTATNTMIRSSGGIAMIVSVKRMIAWSSDAAVEAGQQPEQRADDQVERRPPRSRR